MVEQTLDDEIMKTKHKLLSIDFTAQKDLCYIEDNEVHEIYQLNVSEINQAITTQNYLKRDESQLIYQLLFGNSQYSTYLKIKSDLMEEKAISQIRKAINYLKFQEKLSSCSQSRIDNMKNYQKLDINLKKQINLSAFLVLCSYKNDLNNDQQVLKFHNYITETVYDYLIEGILLYFQLKDIQNDSIEKIKEYTQKIGDFQEENTEYYISYFNLLNFSKLSIRTQALSTQAIESYLEQAKLSYIFKTSLRDFMTTMCRIVFMKCDSYKYLNQILGFDSLNKNFDKYESNLLNQLTYTSTLVNDTIIKYCSDKYSNQMSGKISYYQTDGNDGLKISVVRGLIVNIIFTMFNQKYKIQNIIQTLRYYKYMHDENFKSWSDQFIIEYDDYCEQVLNKQMKQSNVIKDFVFAYTGTCMASIFTQLFSKNKNLENVGINIFGDTCCLTTQQDRYSIDIGLAVFDSFQIKYILPEQQTDENIINDNSLAYNLQQKIESYKQSILQPQQSQNFQYLQ